LWLPVSQNPAMAASRHRGWALATMLRPRLGVMLGREQGAPLQSALEVQVMARAITGEVDFRSIKIPPSGRTYEIQCCFVFHVKEGRIDRVHEYFDMDTVKRLTRSAATVGQLTP
jgi:ketosteroid isomerase-like protein